MSIRNIFTVILFGLVPIASFGKTQTSLAKDSIEMVRLVELNMRQNAIDAIEQEGGTIKSHIVDRGETLESIAMRFNCEPIWISTLNPGVELYTGMSIDYAEFPDIKPLTTSSVSDPRMADAYRLLDKGKFKDSAKLFNKILKDSPSSVEAYYGRACAYSQMKKHKQAVRDLSKVIALDVDGIYPEALDLYDYEKAVWEQKKAERAEMWAKIAMGVLEVGAAATNAYFQSRNTTTAPRYNMPQFGPEITLPNGAMDTGLRTPVGTAIVMPPSLNLANYFDANTCNPQFTTDINGNMMVSYPGLASAMSRMNNDFVRDMEATGFRGCSAAQANALRTFMYSNNESFQRTCAIWATPMYPEAYADVDVEPASSFDSISSSNADKPPYRGNCPRCRSGNLTLMDMRGVPNFGLTEIRKKCPDCGEYYMPSNGHQHYKCSSCGYTKSL